MAGAPSRPKMAHAVMVSRWHAGPPRDDPLRACRLVTALYAAIARDASQPRSRLAHVPRWGRTRVDGLMCRSPESDARGRWGPIDRRSARAKARTWLHCLAHRTGPGAGCQVSGQRRTGRPPEVTNDRSVGAKREESRPAVGQLWSGPAGRYGSKDPLRDLEERTLNQSPSIGYLQIPSSLSLSCWSELVQRDHLAQADQ